MSKRQRYSWIGQRKFKTFCLTTSINNLIESPSSWPNVIYTKVYMQKLYASQSKDFGFWVLRLRIVATWTIATLKTKHKIIFFWALLSIDVNASLWPVERNNLHMEKTILAEPSDSIKQFWNDVELPLPLRIAINQRRETQQQNYPSLEVKWYEENLFFWTNVRISQDGTIHGKKILHLSQGRIFWY